MRSFRRRRKVTVDKFADPPGRKSSTSWWASIGFGWEVFDGLEKAAGGVVGAGNT